MYNFNEIELSTLFNIEKIISLFEKQLAPIEAMSSDSFYFWQMAYIKGKEFAIDIDSKPYHLVKGQVIFYPPDLVHTRIPIDNQGCHLAMVSFLCNSPAMSFFKGKIFTPEPDELRILSEIFSYAEYFKWYNEDFSPNGMYLEKQMSPAQLSHLKLSIESLLTSFYRNHNQASRDSSLNRKGTEADFKRVVAFLSENLNRSLSLEEIADNCEISVSSLKRLFSRHANQGVIDYFNELKINYATQALRESSKAISKIAEDLGYSSQFYFSRAFKNKVGISPANYRKLFIKED